MSSKGKGSTIVPPLKLFLVAILVSFGASFHFGFQLTLTNPCQSVFLEFLNGSFSSHFNTVLNKNDLEALWSIIIAILFFGAVFGSLVMRKVAEKLGRKRGLIFTFLLSTASCFLSILSKFTHSFELYAFSRFSFGFSLGIGVGLAAIYLTECSPKACRGSVSMTIGTVIQLGTMAGSILGMPQVFGTISHWWLIYATEAIIMITVTIITLFVHESPSYLILFGNIEDAERSVQFFHNCISKHQLDTAIEEIRENVRLSSQPIGMFEVWKAKYDGRATLIGCIVAMATVFNGMTVICAFAVEIFLHTGLTLFQASIANVALSFISLASCLTAMCVVDRFGRRPLLLAMYFSIVIMNCTIFALLRSYENYHYGWIGVCLLLAFSIFIFCFALGPGPLSFFVTAEMLSQSARSPGQSWSFLVQMISRTLVLSLFLPMRNNIGASWSYLILFVVPIVFAVIFFYFNLPETKGRNVLEVQEQFEKLPSVKGIASKIVRCLK